MYYRFKALIQFCSKIAGVLPKRILKFLYCLIEPFPGIFFVFLRYVIASNICKSIGGNVYIANNVEIRHPEKLQLGSNVSLNKNCYLDALGGIEIGNDVSVAHQSSIVSFDHSWKNKSLPIRKNPLVLAPIKISNDVWIGAGVRILAGVNIGTRCIVAAGSVVTKNIECVDGVLIAGVPAKVKAELD